MEKTQKENEVLKQMGRIIANSYYDMQSVRISTKNRIRDVIRKKIENIPFDSVEEKKEENLHENKYNDKELLELFKQCLKEKKIDQEEYDYTIHCWEMADDSEKIESQYKKAMEEYIEHETIYSKFLEGIRGLGPVLSANLIKEFGYCEKYATVSKLWKHTGNDVANGLAPKKRKGEDLTFSPKLRTLTWKLSDSLLKLNKGFYRGVYDTEKLRQLNREYAAGELLKMYGKPYTAEETHIRLLHAHNRALRKMRKLFLSHYYVAAKELTGQPHKEPFVTTLEGHTNIVSWQDALRRENEIRYKAEETTRNEKSKLKKSKKNK
jgi:hypothetical protein